MNYRNLKLIPTITKAQAHGVGLIAAARLVLDEKLAKRAEEKTLARMNSQDLADQEIISKQFWHLKEVVKQNGLSDLYKQTTYELLKQFNYLDEVA